MPLVVMTARPVIHSRWFISSLVFTVTVQPEVPDVFVLEMHLLGRKNRDTVGAYDSLDQILPAARQHIHELAEQGVAGGKRAALLLRTPQLIRAEDSFKTGLAFHTQPHLTGDQNDRQSHHT